MDNVSRKMETLLIKKKFWGRGGTNINEGSLHQKAASEAWTAEERISKLGVCQQKLLNPKGKENKE